jgi:ADP-ribose pyrophosphatase YjhB (NUDIX family)
VAYENPKIVVGSVVMTGPRSVLLCRRAIEPRKGFWTLPAGYLELGERAEDGARREAWEEARAAIALDRLLAVYSIPRISQVQLIWRATLARPGWSAGPESEAVESFDLDDVPQRDLAFPSVAWALDAHRRHLGGHDFAPESNPPGAEDRPPGL